MDTSRGVPDPHIQVRSVLGALESGDFRQAFELLSDGVPAGPDTTVQERAVPLLVAATDGYRLMAAGRFLEAEQAFGAAARRLPSSLRHSDAGGGHVRAVLHQPPRRSDPIGTEVSLRASRIVWCAQTEIDYWRQLAGKADRLHALFCAVVHVLSWSEFDPGHQRAVRTADTPDDGPPPPIRTVRPMCELATHIRQFGRPTTGRIGRSTWRTAGGYDGIRAGALADLAAQPDPTDGDAPVRPGRLLLWRHARDVG